MSFRGFEEPYNRCEGGIGNFEAIMKAISRRGMAVVRPLGFDGNDGLRGYCESRAKQSVVVMTGGKMVFGNLNGQIFRNDWMISP